MNNEVDFISECFNKSLVTTNRVETECYLDRISCRFINELESTIARKVFCSKKLTKKALFPFFQEFYESSEKALIDAKAGKIIGVLEFPRNFTQSFVLFTSVYSDNGIIQVHLDQTDIQKTFFMKRKLFEIYLSFTEKLMTDCGKSKKAGNPPIALDIIYGDLNFDLRTTIIPGFTLA